MDKTREAAIRYIGANYGKEQLEMLLSEETTPHPVHEEPLIQAFIAGSKSRDEEVDELKERHKEDRLWLESTTEENKFWKELIYYLSEKAIGNKDNIIETVANNMHNWFVGYVKVTKEINKDQEILIKFKDKDGSNYTATWQPSDNYACWQRCGVEADDYSGFLLFPTYKDDEYFCMYYTC